MCLGGENLLRLRALVHEEATAATEKDDEEDDDNDDDGRASAGRGIQGSIRVDDRDRRDLNRRTREDGDGRERGEATAGHGGSKRLTAVTNIRGDGALRRRQVGIVGHLGSQFHLGSGRRRKHAAKARSHGSESDGDSGVGRQGGARNVPILQVSLHRNVRFVLCNGTPKGEGCLQFESRGHARHDRRWWRTRGRRGLGREAADKVGMKSDLVRFGRSDGPRSRVFAARKARRRRSIIGAAIVERLFVEAANAARVAASVDRGERVV